jgi:hypothetical protein
MPPGCTYDFIVSDVPPASFYLLRIVGIDACTFGVFSLGVAALGVIALAFTAIGAALRRSFGVRRGTSRRSPSC